MKKFIAPLQAFVALFLCTGMAWMVFVLASINSTPPTAADLQARNSQDLSFSNMNSTAVALAQQMLVNMVPSPSRSFLLPVTGRQTVTPTPFVAVTLKPIYTPTSSATSSVSRISPTATRKNGDKVVLTATNTPIPTSTLHLPTVTATATRIPTNTDLPTFTAVPTETPQPTPTDVPTDPPTQIPTDPPPVPTDPPTSIPTDPPTAPPIQVEPTATPQG